MVEVNGEWKLYKQNKEVSALTLKEAMLLFQGLAFSSRSVERSERSRQVLNKHWRLSSPAEVLGHFISLTFDLTEKKEVGLRQDYRQCNFFFVLPTLSLLWKNLSENKVCYLTCIRIEGTFPLTNQHPCTFSCFKSSSTNMQDALENVSAQRIIIFKSDWHLTKATVVRRDLRSCTCSWGRDVRFSDRRHLYSRRLKTNFAVEIIPKEEQGWKSIRKWADIWRSANSEQQVEKRRAYCDPCTTTVFISDDRHPHEWPPRLKF